MKYTLHKQQSANKLILHLIREDLKSRKFFDGLRDLGLDDAFYQPDLGTIILQLMGFDAELDRDIDLYYHLSGIHSQDVQGDNDSVERAATIVFNKLVVEKKRRDSGLECCESRYNARQDAR